MIRLWSRGARERAEAEGPVSARAGPGGGDVEARAEEDREGGGYAGGREPAQGVLPPAGTIGAQEEQGSLILILKLSVWLRSLR